MEDTEGDIDDMEEFDELEEMDIIQAEVDADMAAWRQSTLLQMQEEEDMRVALSNSLVTAREEAGHRAAYCRVSQHSKSKNFLRMRTRKPRSNLGDVINERGR
jgi:hypothetical protein